MSKICKIYTLEHPVTGEVRYVGKTEQSLSTRLIKHVHDCKRSKTHRNNWIQSILNQGLRPTISLIDEVSVEDWQIYEKYWISQFRTWGFSLVNGTEGGEAVYSQGQTYEQKHGAEKAKLLKEKLRKVWVDKYANGYINPTKGRVSPLIGKSRSKEAISNWRISREGWKHTEEAKIKVSKSKNGNRSILQVDENGITLKEFSNIYEVVQEFGIRRQYILDVLCGQHNSTSGLRFMYKAN